MRVYLGSDHAGFELKAHLAAWLAGQGHDPVDCGPESYNHGDDYPPYVIRAALRTVRDWGSYAVVIGGSGNGEAIAANKVRGARAVLAWCDETAKLGREHNDANVLSIGARMHETEMATSLVATFLTTPYSGDERHSRRIRMVHDYEETGELPAL